MIKLTLDEVLKGKGVSRYRLAKMTGIRYHIVDGYYKNKVHRYDSDILDRFCKALDCDVSDLIKYEK